MHPDVALLFQAFAKFGPVIAEAIKALETAVPVQHLMPLVQEIDDLFNRLKAAIEEHKAPPAP